MIAKITWQQMKNNYPGEWLVIVDYDLDDSGHITAGIVDRHSKNKKDICLPPIVDRSAALRYTGESTFFGLRSHKYQLRSWINRSRFIKK